jgi:hypothetical protein
MRCVRSQWNSHDFVVPERLDKLVRGEQSLLYAESCTASYVGEPTVDHLRLEKQSQHHNHSSRHGVWFQGCIVSVKS